VLCYSYTEYMDSRWPASLFYCHLPSCVQCVSSTGIHPDTCAFVSKWLKL